MKIGTKTIAARTSSETDEKSTSMSQSSKSLEKLVSMLPVASPVTSQLSQSS